MEHHTDVDLTESSFDEFVSFLFDRNIPPGPGCLLGSGFDKKRARKWLACMLVLVVSVLPVACGRGGSARPVQSYVVTVMAQSGAISHAVSAHVTLD